MGEFPPPTRTESGDVHEKENTMEAMHTDRMDLVDHFKKEKKPYSGPGPHKDLGLPIDPPLAPGGSRSDVSLPPN